MAPHTEQWAHGETTISSLSPPLHRESFPGECPLFVL